jgi:asparagine synthase (glutamine-hydrolysing)
MGFGVPIDAWLRGPLREWAEALLEEGRLRREGFLQPEPVLLKWREHLSGRRNWQYPLWDVLTFQAWAERWISRS